MTYLTKLIARTILIAAFTAVAAGVQAGVITKSPDLGNFWSPLSANSPGTYIYADSFVAPDNGTVTSLGLWLRGGPTDLVLDVFGSLGGNPANGPDSTNVIAQTAVIPGGTFGTLTFVSAATISSLVLVSGQVYWFAANAVGQTGTVGYNVGGHTQNSVYADNGTFWFSNDNTGINFDGRNRTPEMAFQVVTDAAAVPEPESLALLGLGLLGLVAARKRKSSQAV